MKTNTLSLLFVLLLSCVSLSPRAQAVVPPPDGGYPGFNTAEGQNALFSLTTGSANTAVGWHSLFSNTEGSFNTATGAGALLFNIANENTAFGAAALLFNTAGFQNTAVGAAALLNNIGFTLDAPNGGPGSANTGVGARALFSNTTGGGNTANGAQALENNTTGSGNTAIGGFALISNTTGSDNTALGANAGFHNPTGSGNVYIGQGVVGLPNPVENNITRIRNIGSVAIGGATNVVISSIGGVGDGILGYASSSRRYKEDIKPMDKASETLFGLKPVSFRAKNNMAATKVKLYGLIAEDVATVDPDLVVYNAEGRPETVRFDSINAMLLNEFLKEHRKNEEQGATIARLEKQLETVTATLQKVSAQLELNKSAQQVAENNH
jgi:Chaperone of endosialidase